MSLLEELRSFDLFADLPDEELQWIVDHSTVKSFEVGDYLFKNGETANEMSILLEGESQFVFVRNGQVLPGSTQTPGMVAGLMPYSRMTHYTGDGKITAPSRYLVIHKRHFADMVHRSPLLGQRLVARMSDRVRFATQSRQQHEKMLALGKLSAGLAHELNNPAAAVRRASLALQEKFGSLPSLVAELAALTITESQFCAVDDLRRDVMQRAENERLSTIERSEREDDIADWLDDREVDESWLLAEALAESGFLPDDLDRIADSIPEEAIPAMMRWLTFSLASNGMLDEIASAAARIAELIASVKSYSHMDQAPDRQLCDIHKGLESTLTMLGHKLKKKSITIERAFGDLPEIPIFISQLNQVWTNLLDNAIDAVSESGTILIETESTLDHALIRIIDDGTGIPQDVQPRIFEPFFTTKDVGEGSGLGLDIVQRIISQHQGTITVESKPGHTVFTIRLPKHPRG